MEWILEFRKSISKQPRPKGGFRPGDPMKTFSDFVPEYGDYLRDYEVEARREFAVRLLDMFIPSKVGDEKFKEICQGRAEDNRDAGKFFSTCGEIAMFLLERLGYRGKCLNRMLKDENGKIVRSYVYGMNMNRLLFAPKKEGVFVKHLAGGPPPKRGDIFFISNGPPKTEHVGVVRSVTELENGSYEIESYNGGQGGTLDQHAIISTPILSGTKLGSRTLYGWTDIGLLELTEPADLSPPKPE